MSKKLKTTKPTVTKTVSCPEARKAQIKKAAQRREEAKQDMCMRLYGFYCAGFARGMQQTSTVSVVTLANAKTPQEMWAFAFGLESGDKERNSLPMLTLAAFIVEGCAYFTNKSSPRDAHAAML